MQEKKLIAIAGGGTAGHVYPALAIADAYRRARKDLELLFVGTAGGFEAILVPERGYRLEVVRGSPFLGTGAAGKLGALRNLAIGTAQARRLLKTEKAKLVIGLGGYASAGSVLAARSLGLRTAIHEGNIVPGFANRLLGRLVDRIYLGFGEAGWAFPKSRVLVTGNPIRPEIARIGEERRKAPDSISSPLRILVTGGSQGSAFLNRNAPELFQRIARQGHRLEVRHQAGSFDLEPVRAAYRRAAIPALIIKYIDDMAEGYRWAHFAFACSGSQTVSELAASRLPALLVPLSRSVANHQVANAIAFAKAGGGLWVREESWNAASLAERVMSFLGDSVAWKKASEAAGSFTAPAATAELVADCEALMEGEW
jgi:UDP-N-acetylglucosamine--N-acetylmuramyl-(pentapeptide) pyrophosphoryl-undecaprenol N-acetylglucosamine transferase